MADYIYIPFIDDESISGKLDLAIPAQDIPEVIYKNLKLEYNPHTKTHQVRLIKITEYIDAELVAVSPAIQYKNLYENDVNPIRNQYIFKIPFKDVFIE